MTNMTRSNVMSEVEELRSINSTKIKEASDAGEKVVGMYCIFSPQEISLAADAISVTYVEQHRNL